MADGGDQIHGVHIKTEPGTEAQPTPRARTEVYIKQEPGTTTEANIKKEPGNVTEAAPALISVFRRAAARRAAAERQHREAYRGKVWFDDTIQTIDHEVAEEKAGTPKKDEAYDGRFKALNVLKVDFQERRDQWVRATPGKDRPFRYTDPVPFNDGDVELHVGERAHEYAQHQRGIDLPFDGR